jgi:hypothetical protein
MSMPTPQYVKEFNADLGELSINTGAGKHWKRFAAKNIAAIRKTQVEKKKLFITITVDRLEIDIHGEEVPYIIEKGIIKDDFEWVTGVLKSFAEKNKVNYIE